MNKEEMEKWFEFKSKQLNIPLEYLKREFSDELEGKNSIDAPLEIPDEMRVTYKYSLGQQSRFFRELRENKKIYGAKCKKCGKVYCPPRAHCQHCYEPTEWVPLSGQGTIETYTIQYFTNSAFIKKVPFLVAFIKLDGTDFRMISNIEMDNIEEARPGMRVEAVFREERHGSITDFYFKPI